MEEKCFFEVQLSDRTLGKLIFHPYNPSPALICMKFCIRHFLSRNDCDGILKYYHSYCLNKESHELMSSFMHLLYYLSFGNPVKLRNPINLNSVIPPNLTLLEFVDTIETNVDGILYSSPRDTSSVDFTPADHYMIETIFDYTDPHGAFLEFGSYSGKSTQLIEKYFITHPFYYHCVVYGFDSFQGLPEAWRDGFAAGMFSRDGVPPYPETKHIRWKIGYFDQTVPPFLESLAKSSTPISFMHIDCDLYSSTSVILSSLLQYSDQLLLSSTSCTIMLFNELIGYPDFAHHEIKALHEFYRSLNIKYVKSHHVVIELLPRVAYVNSQSVGFRLCLFDKSGSNDISDPSDRFFADGHSYRQF